MSSYRTLGLSVPVTDVIDPQLWRERYATGLRAGATASTGAKSIKQRIAELTGDRDAGEAFQVVASGIPDETIRWHLRAALSELEMKLGVNFGLEVVKSPPIDDGLVLGRDYDRVRERLPYTRAEASDWFRIDLPDSSIISVERIRAYYFDMLVWEFSNDNDTRHLIHLEWSKQGILHIIPIELQSIVVTRSGFGGSGNYGVWHTINLHTSPVPDFWGVDYTVGPISEHGKQPGRIEAVLAHWCYCVAGILLLSIDGLAQSQGLTSASISMDGVSRSIGLQASAIYGLNSALEHALEEATKRIDWKQLRTRKRGLTVHPFSY